MLNFWAGFASCFLFLLLLVVATLVYYWRKFKPKIVESLQKASEAPPLIPGTVKTEYALTLSRRGEGDDLFSLSSAKGKFIFLHYWATWCAPCVKELPNVEKLYQKFSGNDDVLFCITSLDEKTEAVESFLDKTGYTFPAYFKQGVNPPEFTTRSIPVTYLIAPDGTVLLNHAGIANWNAPEFERYLHTLIQTSKL